MTAKKAAKKAAKGGEKAKTKKAGTATKPTAQEPQATSKAKPTRKSAVAAKQATGKGRKQAGKKGVAASEVEARRGENTFNKIQQEAYYLAERDGFRDDPVQYWLAAEVHLGLR